MLEQLQYICNELKDENEIAIIINYGNNAKRYTAIFLCKTAFFFLQLFYHEIQ